MNLTCVLKRWEHLIYSPTNIINARKSPAIWSIQNCRKFSRICRNLSGNCRKFPQNRGWIFCKTPRTFSAFNSKEALK